MYLVMTKVFRVGLVLVFLSSMALMEAWKASPANLAKFSNKKIPDVLGFGTGGVVEPPTDEILPRDQIHSIYKFGYCHPDVLNKQFLHKTANLTLPTWEDTQTVFLYLLQDKHTQRNQLQCIVMKTMVPRKYLFRRSRMPLYYCQGILYLVALEIYQRIELHEFFLQRNVNMPANFLFEFYHPPF